MLKISICKKIVDFLRHVHYSDVELEIPTEKGIKDIKVRWLITKKDGAKNFTMRLFEIKRRLYTTASA